MLHTCTHSVHCTAWCVLHALHATPLHALCAPHTKAPHALCRHCTHTVHTACPQLLCTDSRCPHTLCMPCTHCTHCTPCTQTELCTLHTHCTHCAHTLCPACCRCRHCVVHAARTAHRHCTLGTARCICTAHTARGGYAAQTALHTHSQPRTRTPTLRTCVTHSTLRSVPLHAWPPAPRRAHPCAHPEHPTPARAGGPRSAHFPVRAQTRACCRRAARTHAARCAHRRSPCTPCTDIPHMHTLSNTQHPPPACRPLGTPIYSLPELTDVPFPSPHPFGH